MKTTLRVGMFVSSSLVNSRPQIDRVLGQIVEHANKCNAEVRVLCGTNPKGPDGFIHNAVAALKAKGADVSVGKFSAPWSLNSPTFNAGQDRIRKILDAAPARVIALWDGRSATTKYAIDEARKRGITVNIVDVPAPTARPEYTRQARVSTPVALPAELQRIPALDGIAPAEAFEPVAVEAPVAVEEKKPSRRGKGK